MFRTYYTKHAAFLINHFFGKPFTRFIILYPWNILFITYVIDIHKDDGGYPWGYPINVSNFMLDFEISNSNLLSSLQFTSCKYLVNNHTYCITDNFSQARTFKKNFERKLLKYKKVRLSETLGSRSRLRLGWYQYQSQIYIIMQSLKFKYVGGRFLVSYFSVYL